MNKRITVGAAAMVAAVTLSAGCGVTNKAAQPFLDAPQMGNPDTGAALTIAMPDGFNNVAAKCHGKDGIYVIFHGDGVYGAVTVVPNDPNCVTGTYR